MKIALGCCKYHIPSQKESTRQTLPSRGVRTINNSSALHNTPAPLGHSLAPHSTHPLHFQGRVDQKRMNCDYNVNSLCDNRISYYLLQFSSSPGQEKDGNKQ